jgi:hypothetical protein
MKGLDKQMWDGVAGCVTVWQCERMAVCKDGRVSEGWQEWYGGVNLSNQV